MPNWKKIILSGSDASLNSLVVANGITGSLFGTSSWANNAVTASFVQTAQTASYVLNAVSSSFANNALTASFVATSSWANNSITASYALSSLSASFATNATTASYVLNAVSSSFATTASFAVSASWAPGGGSTSPGGSDQAVQFNSSSAFSGNDSLTYDYTLNSLKQGLNVLASGSYSHAQGTNTIVYPNTTLTTTSATFVGFDFNGYGIVSITTSSIIVSGDVQGDVPSIPYTLTSFQLDSTNINLTYYGDHIITSASYDGSSDTTFFISLSSSYDSVEINTLNSSGSYSHAEGFGTLSVGLASHAEGYKTTAIGNFSHSEGDSTTASGSYSHAEGRTTLAQGTHSHAEGSSTQALGANSHAEGQNTRASNQAAHAEGIQTIASGQGSHSEGIQTIALGNFSHAEGYQSHASGDYSHVEGFATSASSEYSHAEGRETKASNTGTHAEGRETNATGQYSHTEGHLTYTLGNYSHAEGFYTTASAAYSHAEGRDTIAKGLASHAEGSASISVGEYSHAEGLGTLSSGSYQLAIGQYNTHNNDSSLFIIGNGASDASRSDLALFNKTNITFNKPTVITGSLRGNVSALTIASNTASVDMTSGSFFTLTLANGATTHINPTNINPGQTVNIQVTQGSAGTGVVSFPTAVKQPTGSLYTGSAVADAIDIVTLITFDSTTVFLSSVRNMI